MKSKYLTQRNFEILLYMVSFGLLFAWGFVQPFGDPPDEICRYLVPYYMYQHGSLPNGNNIEVIVGVYGISYAFFPALPYMFQAVFMKLVSFFTENPFALLMAARTVNMIAGVISVYFAREISKKVFHRPLFAWLFTLLFAFWPQAFFLRTYVNCDSFAIMSIAIMMYGLIIGLDSNWSKKSYITLAIGVSICGLSYYNAYGMILASVFIFVCSFITMEHTIEHKKLHFDYKRCLRIGGIIAALVVILIGWWFLRNAILYDGDLLGFASNKKLSEIYAIDAYKASSRVTIQNSGKPISYLFTDGNYINILTLSSIGIFGFMHILSPVFVFRGFKFILLMGLIGLVISKKKMLIRNPKTIGLHIGFLMAILIPFVLCIYYSYSSDYQPQGRYLLPGLLPLLYFIVLGIQGGLERFVKNIWIQRVIVGGAIIFIIVAFLVDFEIIYRMYYNRLSETMSFTFDGG
ncbi:MAG TPA: hypothetical protein VJZ04_05220, partial [Lachnospiraceae bacterium]|nr:hypothetical protein [Lachnospiraceae bacterium]